MAGRAWVLGGGGVGGIGRLAGRVYGLSEAGVDLGGADAVFSTSAGSAVAAQLLSLRTPRRADGSPSRASGGAVVTPSAAAKDAIGRDALDPAVRAASARPGREQAKEDARQVARVRGG